ncbi:hypothetical protein KFK09_020684 [Dendrobium nobile]|uniref:Uncharacterized protein n=1 Tax=Dendrobium nobile TaxID=94219 RepID=A0A8T3AMI3_DENNO|nr:hypothetical protein KFK09_020684 [Dendrobium nobile]
MPFLLSMGDRKVFNDIYFCFCFVFFLTGDGHALWYYLLLQFFFIWRIDIHRYFD